MEKEIIENIFRYKKIAEYYRDKGNEERFYEYLSLLFGEIETLSILEKINKEC